MDQGDKISEETRKFLYEDDGIIEDKDGTGINKSRRVTDNSYQNLTHVSNDQSPDIHIRD